MNNDCKSCAWQPIETAPKDGSPVLVFKPGYVMYVAWWNGTMWTFLLHPKQGDLGIYGVTHWQPLPAPPKALKPSTQATGEGE